MQFESLEDGLALAVETLGESGAEVVGSLLTRHVGLIVYRRCGQQELSLIQVDPNLEGGRAWVGDVDSLPSELMPFFTGLAEFTIQQNGKS